MASQSLFLDVRVGESVSIDNGRVILTLKEKSGQRAKLHFTAEKAVRIEPMRSRAVDVAKNGIPAAAKATA